MDSMILLVAFSPRPNRSKTLLITEKERDFKGRKEIPFHPNMT